jgi:hypothetical protein
MLIFGWQHLVLNTRHFKREKNSNYQLLQSSVRKHLMSAERINSLNCEFAIMQPFQVLVRKI